MTLRKLESKLVAALVVLALAFAVALVLVLVRTATSDGGANTVRQGGTTFSAKAPHDFRLVYHADTGGYELTSRRKEAYVRYFHVRSARSPRAAARFIIQVWSEPAVRTREGTNRYHTLLGDGRMLDVRRAGRGRLIVTEWFAGRGRARRSAALRALLGRIARSARGGSAVTLRKATSQPPHGGSVEPPMGAVVASADFEDATSGGMNIQQCYPGDLSFPGVAAQDDRVGTYTVREGFNEPQTGGERCETIRGDIPSQQTYYTRAWMRVPASSQFNEYLTTIQWKTTDESAGPPPLDLFLLPPEYRGDEYLSLRSGDSSTIAWDSPTIQRDKWYRIVVKAYFDADPTKGWVEVWFGDTSKVTKQVMTDGADRFYMKNAVPNSTHHFRFGIRRADANTGTTALQYDDLSIERASP